MHGVTPETELPLTRHALTWWLRWCAADARGRQQLRRTWGLPDDQAAALERLEQNLRSMGPPQDWFSYRSSGAAARPEKVDQLLSGLHVPEGAFRELLRALRVSPLQEQWLETALKKRLRPRWAADLAQQERRRREERQAREESRRPILAALVTTLAAELDRRRAAFWKERTANVSTATSNGAARNGTAPAGWAWPRPEKLSDLQADLWDYLQEQEIPLDQRLPWEQHRVIAKALDSSPGSIHNALGKLRSKCGICRDQLRDVPVTHAPAPSPKGRAETTAPAPPSPPPAPTLPPSPAAEDAPSAESAPAPEPVPAAAPAVAPEPVAEAAPAVAAEPAVEPTPAPREETAPESEPAAPNPEPVAATASALPVHGSGESVQSQVIPVQPGPPGPRREQEYRGAIALRIASGMAPAGPYWESLSFAERGAILSLAAQAAALVTSSAE